MTPTTIDNLRDTILQWCFDITGRELVLANSGQGAKPRNPYVDVFLTQYDNVYRGNNTLSDDGLTETITASQPFTVTINLYGDNPMQDASKLARSLWSAKRYLDLWQVCGLQSINTAQDLTSLETGALKQRSLLEFVVNAFIGDTFSSDFIQELPIDVEVPENNYSVTVDGEKNPRQKAAICNS